MCVDTEIFLSSFFPGIFFFFFLTGILLLLLLYVSSSSDFSLTHLIPLGSSPRFGSC